jgi:hypothetical protein
VNSRIFIRGLLAAKSGDDTAWPINSFINLFNNYTTFSAARIAIFCERTGQGWDSHWIHLTMGDAF